MIDGWFQNGTWAKAKVIAKSKMTQLLEEKESLSEEYKQLVRLPDSINPDTKLFDYVDRSSMTRPGEELVTAIRSMALLGISRAKRARSQAKKKLPATEQSLGDDGEGAKVNEDEAKIADVSLSADEEVDLEEEGLDEDDDEEEGDTEDEEDEDEDEKEDEGEDDADEQEQEQAGDDEGGQIEDQQELEEDRRNEAEED